MPLITTAFAAALLGADADGAVIAETECVLEAMAYESMGEGIMGMRAVAEVIMNRSDSDYYSESYCAIIRQSGQFEFVSRKKLKQTLPAISDETRMMAARVWFSYQYGDLKRNVLLPCHTTFINPTIVRKRRSGSLPEWWKAGRVPITIGNHEFRCEGRTYAALYEHQR